MQPAFSFGLGREPSEKALRCLTVAVSAIVSKFGTFGQFQNGETGLGILFLTGEVAAVAAATIAFGIHESIPRQPADVGKARSAETSSKVVNLISVGAFFVLAAGGIVQAHLAFVPETYDTRKRTLPPQFLRIEPIIAPTAGGATFGLSGAF